MMFMRFVDLPRFFVHVLTREHSPRQLALGVALGVVLGLMPKLNLIAGLLVILLFALRINILAGLATALVCSWLGMLVDPILAHLGRAMLTLVPLQPLFAWLYQLPFAPWTAFNNTVVMGALLVGLLQFYPTYRFSRRYFEQRWGAHREWRVRPTSNITTPDRIINAWRMG